jgi:hypothetical protein
MKYKWYAKKDTKNNVWYAYRNITISRGSRKTYRQSSIGMHQVILNGKNIDHINRESLDNRRCNLRFCSMSENKKNSKIYKNNTSGITGVSWHKRLQKWQASLGYRGSMLFLGYFSDKSLARLKVEEKSKELFGEFCPER